MNAFDYVHYSGLPLFPVLEVGCLEHAKNYVYMPCLGYLVKSMAIHLSATGFYQIFCLFVFESDTGIQSRSWGTEWYQETWQKWVLISANFWRIIWLFDYLWVFSVHQIEHGVTPWSFFWTTIGWLRWYLFDASGNCFVVEIVIFCFLCYYIDDKLNS